jgi:hypothetical protein
VAFARHRENNSSRHPLVVPVPRQYEIVRLLIAKEIALFPKQLESLRLKAVNFSPDLLKDDVLRIHVGDRDSLGLGRSEKRELKEQEFGVVLENLSSPVFIGSVVWASEEHFGNDRFQFSCSKEEIGP